MYTNRWCSVCVVRVGVCLCCCCCLCEQNFGPILGHGIFTSDGEQWYWQRKLATNIFSVKR